MDTLFFRSRSSLCTDFVAPAFARGMAWAFAADAETNTTGTTLLTVTVDVTGAEPVNVKLYKLYIYKSKWRYLWIRDVFCFQIPAPLGAGGSQLKHVSIRPRL